MSQVFFKARLLTRALVQGEIYKSNHFVYVKGEGTTPKDKEEHKSFWVARILQVRAKDPQHVYALVSALHLYISFWPHS